MSLLRLPKAPRFDHASGENPFAWIIKAAEQHREQRTQALAQHRQERSDQQRADNKPVGGK